MKIILMSIGLFSLFQTGLSTRCYSCNAESLNFNDLQCNHPEQVLCDYDFICAKLSHTIVVIRGCIKQSNCKAKEFTFTGKNGTDLLVNCCDENYCNGSENIFQSKVFFLLLFCFLFLNYFSEQNNYFMPS